MLIKIDNCRFFFIIFKKYKNCDYYFLFCLKFENKKKRFVRLFRFLLITSTVNVVCKFNHTILFEICKIDKIINLD